MQKQVLANISRHFGDSLLVMSANGFANVFVFKSQAHGFLNHETDTETEEKIAISCLAKKIKEEIQSKPINRQEYQTRINVDNILSNVSPTLLSLLAEISSNLSHSIVAGMIGNMISSSVKKFPQPIQIGAGVLLQSKSLIETFYKLGVTCSYEEVKTFRSSAAVATQKDAKQMRISSSDSGVAQVISDIFDANSSSPNGLILEVYSRQKKSHLLSEFFSRL